MGQAQVVAKPNVHRRQLSVKGRVARALLSLAEAFGKDVGNGRILIRQKVNQSDLAAMAGIACEKCQPGVKGLDVLPPASENRYLRSLIELMILFATPYSIASDADIQ